MKIKLSEASASQLANFAQLNLGLQADYRMGQAKLISLIRQSNPDIQEIEADEAAAPAVPAAPKKPRNFLEGLGPEDKVMVYIPAEDRKGGDEPLQVGVNGTMILIPRGVEAPIKYKHLHVLQNAVRSVAVMDENGNITGWRNTPRHQISILGPA